MSAAVFTGRESRRQARIPEYNHRKLVPASRVTVFSQRCSPRHTVKAIYTSNNLFKPKATIVLAQNRNNRPYHIFIFTSHSSYLLRYPPIRILQRRPNHHPHKHQPSHPYTFSDFCPHLRPTAHHPQIARWRSLGRRSPCRRGRIPARCRSGGAGVRGRRRERGDLGLHVGLVLRINVAGREVLADEKPLGEEGVSAFLRSLRFNSIRSPYSTIGPNT